MSISSVDSQSGYVGRYAAGTPVDGTSESSATDLINRPAALSRHLVEVLFYLVVGNSLLEPFTGLSERIRFAAAGPAVISGTIALVILMFRAEPLPRILWFIVAMNLGATLSESVVSGALPVLSESLSPFVFWFFTMTMACYIVENDAARKRTLIVLTLFVLCFVYLGGISLVGYAADKRLDLKEVAGGNLGDANTLAYFVGVLAISMLFWSLRSAKLIRPVLWLLAAVLLLILVRTVSRGGLLAFGSGMMVLLTAIMMGRGVRLSGIVLVIVALIGALVLASAAASSIEYLHERLLQPTEDVRLKVYSMHTVEQMAETIVFGNGPAYARTSAGVNAHNSFINTHLVYGGITAWTYLAMLLLLAWRLKRFVMSSAAPLDTRLWALAVFGIALASQIMTNLGYLELQSIIAFAMVDRLTAPYTRRASRQRSMLSANELMEVSRSY